MLILDRVFELVLIDICGGVVRGQCSKLTVASVRESFCFGQLAASYGAYCLFDDSVLQGVHVLAGAHIKSLLFFLINFVFILLLFPNT